MEEWDETHAKFTFFKETVELLVLFGPLAPGAGEALRIDTKLHCLWSLYGYWIVESEHEHAETWYEEDGGGEGKKADA